MPKKMTRLEFIQKAKKVHGDKYDYSKVEYINNSTKVLIICPKHGEFWQIPNTHLLGHGCPKCKGEKNSALKRKTTEQFIEEAKKVHNNFYSCEKTKYINQLTKITITCPIHGDFEQITVNHLKRNKCPRCAFSNLEKKFENLLIENQITYEYQKKFSWLGRQSLDFYLPEYNIAIECQGRQHFVPIEYLGGESAFKENIKRDIRKKNLCEKNDVKLLYYTDLKKYNVFQGQKVFKNDSDILKEIVNEKEK